MQGLVPAWAVKLHAHGLVVRLLLGAYANWCCLLRQLGAQALSEHASGMISFTLDCLHINDLQCSPAKLEY